MTTKSFEMDADALKALVDLRDVFGVSKDSEVVIRLLQLGRLAGHLAGDAKTITPQGSGEPHTITLNQ